MYIYAELLLEGKIFPVIPKSKLSAQWSLKYAQKWSKSGVKDSKFPVTTVCTLGYSMVEIVCLDDAFTDFLNWKQAQ